MSAKSSMDAEEPLNGEEDGNKFERNSKLVEEAPSLPVERDVDYDSDTPPTAEQWKEMKGYGSFITHDEADDEYVFHVNDFIYVLPTGRDPDQEHDKLDLWLAQIRSIRAYDSDSVWIRAKWFYHPTELPKNVKSMNRNLKLKQFGTFERINSNQADFISTATCCGHAKIIEYDERSLEQEDIEYGSVYYRCNYDWTKRILERSPLPCSICKKAYNPDTDIMHFCPRPQCRRAWHTPCLAKANWLIRSSENFLQRLESLDGEYASPDVPKPRPKKKARTKKSGAVPLLDGPYARIPVDLLTVARQPIVRGGSLGVVGNVRSVVRARTMVQDALRGFEDIPRDWTERLGDVYDVSDFGPSVESRKRKALSYQCPQCGEPI